MSTVIIQSLTIAGGGISNACYIKKFRVLYGNTTEGLNAVRDASGQNFKVGKVNPGIQNNFVLT